MQTLEEHLRSVLEQVSSKNQRLSNSIVQQKAKETVNFHDEALKNLCDR